MIEEIARQNRRSLNYFGWRCFIVEPPAGLAFGFAIILLIATSCIVVQRRLPNLGCIVHPYFFLALKCAI